MRYILDDRGYVKYCSDAYFNCENKSCALYEGIVPAGYGTIEEWANTANIRAYKIVNGNLVYDSTEDARLQEEYKRVGICDSETPTNDYLNGKRVYKKLFTGKMTSTYGTNTALVDLGFEFTEAWIDQSLSFLTKKGETVPTTFYYSDTDYLRTWINKDVDGHHIRIRAGLNYSAYNYNIVVAYTKD